MPAKLIAAVGPRRRSPTGGYPVGDDTRQRIIATAIPIFASHGFDGASTRTITKEAGVKQPAIQYYFNGKPGLYDACVEHVTTLIWARLGPVVEEGLRLLRDSAPPEDLIESYCRLQDSLIDAMALPEEGGCLGRFWMMETSNPATAHAQRLMSERIHLRLFEVISGIIGRIIGRRPDELETGLHSFALSGLFMVFHMDSVRIDDALGWTLTEGANADMTKKLLRLQATTLLENLARIDESWRPKRKPRKRSGSIPAKR